MAEKIFTVEEAEAMIPQLETILSSILEHKRNAAEIGEELAGIQRVAQENNGLGVDPSLFMNKQTELEFLIEIIGEGLEAIEKLGCHPKDLDMGLVDFPAIIDGESVLLCWRYGEKSIDYYHDHVEGFSGRKPLKKS